MRENKLRKMINDVMHASASEYDDKALDLVAILLHQMREMGASDCIDGFDPRKVTGPFPGSDKILKELNRLEEIKKSAMDELEWMIPNSYEDPNKKKLFKQQFDKAKKIIQSSGNKKFIEKFNRVSSKLSQFIQNNR